jgi:hypothetical protein
LINRCAGLGGRPLNVRVNAHIGGLLTVVKAPPASGAACGVPELGYRSLPGLLCGSLVFVDEAAEDSPAFDPLLGEADDRVVGPGRPELRLRWGRRPL